MIEERLKRWDAKDVKKFISFRISNIKRDGMKKWKRKKY
jgi:hypothetical protein